MGTEDGKKEQRDVVSRLGFLLDGVPLVSRGRYSCSKFFRNPKELLFITYNHHAPLQIGGKTLQFQFGSRATVGKTVPKHP